MDRKACPQLPRPWVQRGSGLGGEPCSLQFLTVCSLSADLSERAGACAPGRPPKLFPSQRLSPAPPDLFCPDHCWLLAPSRCSDIPAACSPPQGHPHLGHDTSLFFVTPQSGNVTLDGGGFPPTFKATRYGPF